MFHQQIDRGPADLVERHLNGGKFACITGSDQFAVDADDLESPLGDADFRGGLERGLGHRVVAADKDFGQLTAIPEFRQKIFQPVFFQTVMQNMFRRGCESRGRQFPSDEIRPFAGHVVDLSERTVRIERLVMIEQTDPGQTAPFQILDHLPQTGQQVFGNVSDLRQRTVGSDQDLRNPGIVHDPLQDGIHVRAAHAEMKHTGQRRDHLIDESLHHGGSASFRRQLDDIGGKIQFGSPVEDPRQIRADRMDRPVQELRELRRHDQAQRGKRRQKTFPSVAADRKRFVRMPVHQTFPFQFDVSPVGGRTAEVQQLRQFPFGFQGKLPVRRQCADLPDQCVLQLDMQRFRRSPVRPQILIIDFHSDALSFLRGNINITT